MNDDIGDLTAHPVPETATKPRPRRLSEILGEIAADETRERISVGELLRAMGDRAFGALMFVFAVPNVIPTPPGTSTLLGAPLVLLAAQMTFGLKPWLPRLIADRTMGRRDFANMIERATPWMQRAERLLRPRLSFLVYPPIENLVGLICLMLAIVLVLPVPLGNILPAFAICLFSFGILERDGIWTIAGVAATVVAMTIAGGVIYAMIKATIFLFSNAF